MKAFASLAVFAALAARVAALTVDTPASLVECLPARLTWREGTAPYFPSVIPAGQPSAPPLKTFPQTNDEALTWTVDLQAGTSINFAIRDSTGEQQFTSIITIQAGTDSSCLNATSSTTTGGSTTGAGTSPAPAPTNTTPSSTTTSGTTGGSNTSTTPRPTTTGTGTTTGNGAQNTNGAIRSSVNALGFAGVMGLLGAALF